MWHRHPDSGDDAMVPASWPTTVTRDDLVRLVVGMQWQVAVTLYAIADEVDGGSMYGINARLLSRLPCAVDIVDEWLGVR